MTLIACGTSAGYAASISGTVKGQDGAALKGVFVEAQNKKTHMTFMVLSGDQGHYRLERLPAGEYALSTKITGFRGDPLTNVNLTADQIAASFDLSLRKAPVRLE